MLKEYITKIDDACGEGGEFIVTLRYNKRDEALRRVLEKCHVEKSLSVLTKVKFKNKDISIFKTGKLIISKFRGREEAKSFLEELFNDQKP